VATQSRDEIVAQVNEDTKKSLQELRAVATLKALEAIRVQYWGKSGSISSVVASLRNFAPEDRKEIGRVTSEARVEFETQYSERNALLEAKELEATLLKNNLDSSAPGVYHPIGTSHPIRLVLREAIRIFEIAGLAPVYGPEVEYEEYCFDKLNFKPGHAARDMQATFFVKDAPENKKLVLRTHTSPVQVRVLMKAAQNGFALPLRVQVPGRTYRVDDDSTHAPMFHQIEGLAVDKSSTMGDLRAVLDFFFRKFFDEKTKIRFRPSYFPFTEPSAEVDVSCVFCSGEGCKVCKHSGWLEVAGAGMVHPEVFELCGWDSKSVQGWAFGLGIERLAMLKLGVPDLRLFFDNRLSFLHGSRKSKT
jgi:phenylalanyl-tRNA synthetase alpha chain